MCAWLYICLLSHVQRNKEKIVTGRNREIEEGMRIVQLANREHASGGKSQYSKLIIDTSCKSLTSLKFVIQSAYYDLLPTPANKNVWFISDEKCMFIGEEFNLNHVPISY